MKRKEITRNLHKQKQRNIGIIAHVDAGKTTVTERILFYTGAKHEMGETHDGRASMDTMPVEVKHGITVSAAATTVGWKDSEITIIDTPGHVDFNLEVLRALRVLDGGVVVLDAVAGVEPQTEANWSLADRFRVPRICFVNKMDRAGADFAKACQQVREILGARPIPLQLPVFEGGAFVGVIDLVELEKLTFAGEFGEEVERHPVPVAMQPAAGSARAEMIEIAADFDEQVLAAFLDGNEPSGEAIRRAIRAGTLAGEIQPVLCGSALRNCGIQPLLDAAGHFLPSPCDVAAPSGVPPGGFAALAFKTKAMGNFGALTFLRLYSGELQPGDVVENSQTGKRERIGRIFQMHADSYTDLTSAQAGDIVAVPGLKWTSGGDTLCESGSGIVLDAFTPAEPLAEAAIEPAEGGDADRFAQAIGTLVRDDPALRLRRHPETGDLVLAGMGELHLKIAIERLESEFGVRAKLGRPQVAYREALTRLAEVRYLHKKQSGGPGQRAGVTLRLEPASGDGIEIVNAITGGAIPLEFIPAVESGIRSAASSGPVSGSPIQGVRVTIVDGEAHSNDSSSLAFESAAMQAFAEAAKQAGPMLLEPVVRATIAVPEEYLGAVMGDLGRRRATILGQSEQPSRCVVEARMPLAETFGYIGILRSLTSGRGTYSAQADGYAPAPTGALRSCAA